MKILMNISFRFCVLLGFILFCADLVLPEVRVLDVHVTPLLSEATPPFTLNRQVQLMCDVIASPPIAAENVGWLVGEGERIMTSYKYTVYRYPDTGTAGEIRVVLTVNGMSVRELGTYSCEARNSAGMYTRRSVHLYTEDKRKIMLKEIEYLKSETKTGELVTYHSNITHVTRTSYVPGNVTQNVTARDTSSSAATSSCYVTISVCVIFNSVTYIYRFSNG